MFTERTRAKKKLSINHFSMNVHPAHKKSSTCLLLHGMVTFIKNENLWSFCRRKNVKGKRAAFDFPIKGEREFLLMLLRPTQMSKLVFLSHFPSSSSSSSSSVGCLLWLVVASFSTN